jgi:hypothetical protein
VAQVDLPPEHCEAAQRIVLSINYTGRFDQLPVGPTLFLRANQLIGGWDNAPRQLAVSAPALSG